MQFVLFILLGYINFTLLWFLLIATELKEKIQKWKIDKLKELSQKS